MEKTSSFLQFHFLNWEFYCNFGNATNQRSRVVAYWQWNLILKIRKLENFLSILCIRYSCFRAYMHKMCYVFNVAKDITQQMSICTE